MGGAFQADTLRLKQHTDIVLQEAQTARLLCARLECAREYAPLEETWRYDQVIQKVEKLVQYFQAMVDQVDHMSLELELLSTEIATLLRDVCHSK